MVWVSQGTVSVAEDWSVFPVTSFGAAELVRLTHFTTFDRFNRCYLTRYFPAPGEGGTEIPLRLIYADSNPQILHLPLAQGMIDSEIFSFVLMVKRRYPYYPNPWTIHAEVFYP